METLKRRNETQRAGNIDLWTAADFGTSELEIETVLEDVRRREERGEGVPPAVSETVVEQTSSSLAQPAQAHLPPSLQPMSVPALPQVPVQTTSPQVSEEIGALRQEVSDLRAQVSILVSVMQEGQRQQQGQVRRQENQGSRSRDGSGGSGRSVRQRSDAYQRSPSSSQHRRQGFLSPPPEACMSLEFDDEGPGSARRVQFSHGDGRRESRSEGGEEWGRFLNKSLGIAGGFCR